MNIWIYRSGSKDILKDIGLQEHFKEIKEWYDGYNFGKIDVYCPWDVNELCKRSTDRSRHEASKLLEEYK